ncbi:MAG: hypothetical protein ACRD4Q_05970 [Candidatus Acidiferrales bacterium]
MTAKKSTTASALRNYLSPMEYWEPPNAFVELKVDFTLRRFEGQFKTLLGR